MLSSPGWTTYCPLHKQTWWKCIYFLKLKICFIFLVKVYHHSAVNVDTLFAKAMMTLPRLARLLLIACVSFSRAPWDPDSLRRSLPARSIRFSNPGMQKHFHVNIKQKYPKLFSWIIKIIYFIGFLKSALSDNNIFLNYQVKV